MPQKWDATLPETNIQVAPENGWLEYDPFLLGSNGLFSGANLPLVSGRVAVFLTTDLGGMLSIFRTPCLPRHMNMWFLFGNFY